MRTTITNPNGTIAQARVNTATGEIKPYKHWKAREIEEERQRIEIKGSVNTDFSKPYHWEIILPPDYSFTTNKHTKQTRKNKPNDNNIYLKDYLNLGEAKEELPCLDNLFTGVSLLDSGRTRPINQGLMFNMLRDLDVINVQTVQEYTGYSDKYCYNLVTYLTVLSNAFDAEIDM